MCPSNKSFCYALTRVIGKVGKFNRSKTRPQVTEELLTYLDSSFIFPEADVRKKDDHE